MIHVIKSSFLSTTFIKALLLPLPTNGNPGKNLVHLRLCSYPLLKIPWVAVSLNPAVVMRIQM